MAAPAFAQPAQPLPAADVLDSQSELTPIVDEAIRRWAAVAGSQALAGVSVQIADLPGNMLGETIGKTILIDRDAAGYGWFIDPTPQRRFRVHAGWLRRAGRPAADRRRRARRPADGRDARDGPRPGLRHDAGGDLMDATLPLGVRRPPAVDQALARALRRPLTAQ